MSSYLGVGVEGMGVGFVGSPGLDSGEGCPTL